MFKSKEFLSITLRVLGRCHACSVHTHLGDYLALFISHCIHTFSLQMFFTQLLNSDYTLKTGDLSWANSSRLCPQ